MYGIRVITAIAIAMCPAGLAVAQVGDLGMVESFQAQKSAAKAADLAQYQTEYQKGESAIDSHQWEAAVKAFNAAAAAAASHADGALYWKAYALSKMGQVQQSIAALKELQKVYANSRWLDDAKA